MRLLEVLRGDQERFGRKLEMGPNAVNDEPFGEGGDDLQDARLIPGALLQVDREYSLE